MEKDTRGSSQLSTKGIGSTVQHLASSSLNMFNSFVDTIGNVGKEGHKPRPGFESRTFVPSKSPFNGCDQSHQSTKNLVGSGAIADSLSSASPIQLSDRVRCFLVHDYYIGTVKWLGRLPEERERMGGIDFVSFLVFPKNSFNGLSREKDCCCHSYLSDTKGPDALVRLFWCDSHGTGCGVSSEIRRREMHSNLNSVCNESLQEFRKGVCSMYGRMTGLQWDQLETRTEILSPFPQILPSGIWFPKSNKWRQRAYWVRTGFVCNDRRPSFRSAEIE